jgi:hypothetical protein
MSAQPNISVLFALLFSVDNKFLLNFQKKTLIDVTHTTTFPVDQEQI